MLPADPVPRQAKVACATLDRLDDPVGDMLMDVETLGWLAGRFRSQVEGDKGMAPMSDKRSHPLYRTFKSLNFALALLTGGVALSAGAVIWLGIVQNASHAASTSIAASRPSVAAAISPAAVDIAEVGSEDPVVVTAPRADAPAGANQPRKKIAMLKRLKLSSIHRSHHQQARPGRELTLLDFLGALGGVAQAMKPLAPLIALAPKQP